MDVCIFYEHAQRELNNAFLLKYEFEKRGYSVEIMKIRSSRIPYFKKPKLIITPWLYNGHESIQPIKICFFRGFDKLINLQYEQVISKALLMQGLHCPSGLAQNATHICWSEKIKRRLMSVGVPEDNCLVVGDLRCDFSRDPFKKIFKSKEMLGEEFGIPIDNKWNLFISSFSYTTLDEEHEKFLLKLMPNEELFYEFVDVQTKSKKEVLRWIEEFISNHPDIEFIYRPHPSELEDIDLINLKKRYVNFHCISKYSIQEWIVNSDIINSWFSTSLIEVYSFGKNCNILRPFKLNEIFDVPYMINADHIKDYDSFERCNLFDNEEFPVSEEQLREYYLIEDYPVYKKIVDYAEIMMNSDEYKSNFYKYPPFLENLYLLLPKIFGKSLIVFLKEFLFKHPESIENEEYFSEKRKTQLKEFVYNE